MKVHLIEIDGFWLTKKASAKFNDQVNIIIGKNGTGKTTFMNIIHAILTVDTEALFNYYFKTVKIILKEGKQIKTIKVNRIDENIHTVVRYQISSRIYQISLILENDRSYPLSIRRRVQEEIKIIKNELSNYVKTASLSVYRTDPDLEFDIRDRASSKNFNSVDSRLSSLINKLNQYQLDLTTLSREVSTQLQKEVLTSLLFTNEKANTLKLSMSFDEAKEKRELTAAYKQLGVSGSEITKKIQEHTSNITKSITALKNQKYTEATTFSAIEALKTTRSIVEKSLQAEAKIKEIYKQIDLFTQILSQFIENKKFSVTSNGLEVVSESSIDIYRLSSGEKQLIILFVEALLQREEPYIFLADEPELSLHISWQRSIISAIKKINPNAQIIVATHSPEIAGNFHEAIIDMEDIING